MSRTLTTALAGALLMAAAPARAESVGPFNYRMPEGWAVCAGEAPKGAAQLCPAQGAARIWIKTGVGGSDAAAMARAEAPGDSLKELDGKVSGQPGHVTVATSEGVIRAAAATAASGGVTITLAAPRAEAAGPARQWGVLVDGASIGDATAPAPAPATATHKVNVVNASGECTAVMFIDGKRVEVPPAGTVVVDVAAGKHLFEWQNPDGSSGSAPGEVPPLTKLTGTCVKGVAPALQPSAAPFGEPSEQRLKPRDVFNGARAAVMFYRTCWNLAVGHQPWPAPVSLDRMMLRVVARRPVAKRPDFVRYQGHQWALAAAIARAGQDGELKARLRRYAAFVLVRAGMHEMPKTCEPAEAQPPPEKQRAALDCIAGGMEKSPPAAVLDEMNHAMVKVIAAADPPPLEDIAKLEEIRAVTP